jgi:hypothetical protein
MEAVKLKNFIMNKDEFLGKCEGYQKLMHNPNLSESIKENMINDIKAELKTILVYYNNKVHELDNTDSRVVAQYLKVYLADLNEIRIAVNMLKTNLFEDVQSGVYK